MKYLYFPGCRIADSLPGYDKSLRAVLSRVGIDLETAAFNCCGYPVRHQSFEAAFLSAAKNFALADKMGLDIMTPCKCCFGNLSHALYWLKKNTEFKTQVQSHLALHGLKWKGETRAFHLLQVLRHTTGLEKLKENVTQPLKGLKVATHYGCHALRPSDVVDLDNPAAPVIFEELIRITGAETVDWSMRTECCGHPISDKNNPLALSLMQKKRDTAKSAGADAICTACTFCQLMFEKAGPETKAAESGNGGPYPVLYTQLLGLAMGMDKTTLGMGDDFVLKTH